MVGGRPRVFRPERFSGGGGCGDRGGEVANCHRDVSQSRACGEPLGASRLAIQYVRCYIVITMKRTQIAIRRIGNSQGILIPKPLLAQVGLEDRADLSIERDALVLRRPAKAARAGWAAAAQKIADQNDDALVMGEFGNEDDADHQW